MAIADKVKLVVVRRDSPDVETELGVYPSKKDALQAFRDAIPNEEFLRVTIEPVDAERNPDNFVSHQRK
jgi:hypothetical protein